MGKKGRLRKERAEAEKADHSSNRIASELGPSSASAAEEAGANSSSTRTTIILPISPSQASILGPAFSPDYPYSTPQVDMFLGLDERGEPRMVVKGSDVYEITKEPASDVYQFVKDPAKTEDIRETSPDRCTRPLNSSPPPSPPSTSAAGTSSPANKRSKKKAAGTSNISNDGSSPSKKGSAGQ